MILNNHIEFYINMISSILNQNGNLFKHYLLVYQNVLINDIELFQCMVDELVDKFDRYGPHTIENDLNQSLLLTKHYQKELNKIEQRKLN